MLFRQQAIDHTKNGLHGDVLLLPKFSHSLLITILVTWVVVVAIWLFTSSYARKETVVGWLEPPNGVIRVYAQDTGIIKKILVNEGDYVVKDQPLIIVNGDRILEDGEHLENRLLAEYQNQHQLLTKQLNRADHIFKSRQINITQRMLSANQDLTLLTGQLSSLSEQHSLLKSQVKRYKTLQSNGLVSSQDFERMVSEELTLRSQKQGLLREQVNRQNLLAQMKIEQDLLPQEHENTIDQLRTDLSNVAQLMARLHGQRAHIVKASRSGIVNNLQVKEGQRMSINSDIPLLTLIPNDSKLIAHLLIPVRSVGFIGTGQALDIRYDAFPYQKFGIYSGKLADISTTILLPNELMNAPVSVKEPMYRVTATLAQADVEAYGKSFPLKSGITLSADVRLSERSLIQWLLEPLYSLQGRI